jgi:hypothetical protein
MIRTLATQTRRFWIAAGCALLAMGALPIQAHAQLTVTSFDIGASPNPVPDDGSTTFSAYVAGISQTPSGTVTFYISGSTASCTGITDGNQIGSGQIDTDTGVATVAYTAYTPGIVPLCAQYSGDDTYASDTAGVYLLTVEQPPSFTVQVVGAAEAQTPVNFAFSITVPNGQALPQGTVTLYDEGNGNSYGPVTINTDGSIPNIDGVTLNDGYYEAEYNPSTGSIYTVQYVNGDVFQENGLTAIIPDLIAAGSGNSTITLDGLNFDGTSVAEMLVGPPGANPITVALPTTYLSPNQLQATIASNFLASSASLGIYVNTADTNYSTNNVTVQVSTPNSDAITVSASPQTFPYGTQSSTAFGSTVTPTATVGGVPAGQVSYILTGPGVDQSMGSSQLSQNTNTTGTYVTAAPAPLDAGSTKILSADLNNDGNFDFVSLPGYYPGDGGDGPYLQVMLSTGADSFATEQELYVGCVPQDFGIGDINNDGFQDIVVACQNPDNAGGFPIAEYLLGNGDGTFQAPVQFASNAIVGLITSPTQVALGDFNGDGILDVALIDGVNGNVQVLFGNYPFNGSYNPSSQNSFDTSQGEVISAGAADFNQDGYSDIGLEEYNYDGGNGAVLVLTSNGYGGFNYTEQYFSATTNEINSMVITDVNGDNYPDIAIAEPGNYGCDCDNVDNGQVIVFENAEYGPGNLGTLNGGYSIPATQATDVTGVPFPATGAPSGTPAVAPNWNLVYAGEAINSTQILVTPLQRLGFDNWQAGTTITTPEIIAYCDCDSSTFPSFLTASDVNSDGYLDFTLFGTDGNYNDQLETVDWSNSAATSLLNSTALPAPGSYTLAASYSGTTLFAGGSSATIPIVIAQGTPTGAITGPEPNNANAGTSVTLTATITGVAGGATPTQSVQFFDNGSAIGAPVQLSSGVATLSTSTLPGGLNTITASYSGDSNYAALGTSQISSYQITINDLSFSLGLSSSTASTTAGAIVTFNVTATGASLPPPEPVTLTGLPTAVTVSPIMTNGVATYSFGMFPPGNYTVQASYAGDSTFLPETSNTVSLQVGNTPITLTPSPSANPVTYPTSISVNAIASSIGFGVPTGSVDFELGPNGGSIDLGSGALSIGNGGSGLNPIGTFGGSVTAVVKDIATVSGDFNDDGIPDLAVLQQTGNTTNLLILIGNGDGTFQTPVAYGVAQSVAANSATLAAADFNGDHYTDLAIGTSDGSILIFLASGDAAGDLTYSQSFGANAENGIAVGDFNHDGIPDLALAGAGSVTVFLGSASGTFPNTASPYYAYNSDGSTFAGIAVADFNNDGYSDIAVSNSTGASATVFLNQPTNSTFGVAQYPVGTSAGAIAAGDVNGDGYQDLAVVSPSDSTVEVLINNQSGGFPTGTAYGVAGQPYAVTIADFNRDGFADIAVAGTLTGQGGGTSILLGSSTGAITGEALLSGTNGLSIATADFNRDANPDLAVGNNGVTTFLDSSALLTLPNVLLPAGSDTITAYFTSTEGSVWATNVNASFVETVNQGTPGITWPTPSPITYGTALSGSQLDATSPIAGSFTYNPAAGTVLDAGTQTLTANFIPTDTTDYQAASAQVNLTVNQAIPSVTWANPAPITYGAALSGIQLDATSPVQGSFSYTPGLGTVLGAGTHTLSVTFTPTDTTDYQAVTTSVSIVVNKATTTVTWNEPAAITYGTALSGTQLDATASVPGTFNYTPGASTVLAAGTHTLSVTFTPTDGTDYQPSTTTTSILVNKATAGITWNNPAAITYGTALSAAQLDATSTVPGTFVYLPVAGTVLAAGTQTLSVTFTPTDTTDYQTVNASVTLLVNKATSAITWANPAAITYGTALSSTQLDATASVPGTFVYNPGAATVLTAGTHTLSVTFTPTDTTDYQTSTDTATIVVNKATTSVTWANPAAITYGTALSGTQLDATAGVPGTFVYKPAAGTVLTAGTHALSVTFTPTDTTDYQTSTGSASIVVNKATASVTWNTPAAITYGTALSATQLNATASVPGTFVYAPPAGTVLSGGQHTLNVTFTPTDAVDYQTANGSVTIIVNKVTTTVTWANPAAITYGTALGAAQLNATASVPGGFAYSPTAGTVLTAGTQTLNVTFTPTDSTDYQVATDSVSIVVKPAASTITWSNPAAITYGTALGAAQLDATSTIAGTFTYKPAAGTVLTAGSHTLSVNFAPTDTTDYQPSTDTVTIIVNKATTTVTWPIPAAITYGTALSAAQLDATASAPGTFAYTPAAGTVLAAGAHSLSVDFTPTDTTDYLPSTGSASIVVNKATPALVWNAPQPIYQGTALSATQLDATATPAGGTFSYTPPIGTILPIGNQTLSVTYTPKDTTDYTTASTTVTLVVGPDLVLSSISPSSGTLEQAATTITLTGVAFSDASTVQLNGTTIASHFVNSTQMTAVIPASFFTQIQTGQVTVTSNGVTTPGLTFTVSATTVQATLSGPSTAPPGEQPTINFTLSQGYALPLKGTFTLTVVSAVPGGVVDPAVQFSTGGTTLNFTIPANSTTTPTVQLQTGTLAATITVTLTLTADGQNVTPESISPVVIDVPATAPVISSIKLVRSGDSLTVTVEGFSSSRDMTSATFHFTPAGTATLSDSQVVVDVSDAFTSWYSLGTSDQYGSAFTYTQTFQLSNSSTNIQSVSVTLTNSVGKSTPVSAN